MVVVQCVENSFALPPEAHKLGILERPQLVADGYQLVTVSELLGLPEIVCSAEKYVYNRRDTEENIRPDAVPQN